VKTGPAVATRPAGGRPGDPRGAAFDPLGGRPDPGFAPRDPRGAPQDPRSASRDPRSALPDPRVASFDPWVPSQDPPIAPRDPRVASCDPTVESCASAPLCCTERFERPVNGTLCCRSAARCLIPGSPVLQERSVVLHRPRGVFARGAGGDRADPGGGGAEDLVPLPRCMARAPLPRRLGRHRTGPHPPIPGVHTGSAGSHPGLLSEKSIPELNRRPAFHTPLHSIYGNVALTGCMPVCDVLLFSLSPGEVDGVVGKRGPG
jgi:hypothetical protein